MNAKIKVLWIFGNFQLRHTFQEQIALKLLEIDWDSLHIKLLALNTVFTSLNFAFLHSTNSPYGGVKLRYSLENTCIQPLEWQQPCETVAPSGVYECMVRNVSCLDL